LARRNFAWKVGEGGKKSISAHGRNEYTNTMTRKNTKYFRDELEKMIEVK